jgi:hypothetical protein
MFRYKFLVKVLLSFIFLITPLFSQNDSLYSEITLKTFLEKENVPLNMEVIYHVELTWFGGLDDYRINEIIDPLITGLSLRGSGSSNKLLNENGKPKSVRRVTYYFKPQSLGMAYIEGLVIKYTNTITKDSETLSAQRISVKITDPVRKDGDGFFTGTFLQWILLIGFIVVVSYFLVRYYQRKDNRKDEELPQLTIEEKYLELLYQTIHISTDSAKENISDLNKMLSSYIAEKFSIPGTVNEKIILDSLSRLKVDILLINKIKAMLEKIELARFAAEKIEVNEIHMFFDSIENIFKTVNESNIENRGKQE